jgi:hypothetical protein
MGESGDPLEFDLQSHLAFRRPAIVRPFWWALLFQSYMILPSLKGFIQLSGLLVYEKG